MDFNVFKAKLSQKLEGVLQPEGKGETFSLTASGFNSGARTMYNLALVVASEIAAENAKGAQ